MKPYVDSLSENDRKRRNLSTVTNGQDEDFDNIKLTNLVSITVKRSSTIDNEVSNKKMLMTQ